jgi:hypothetical protein
LSKRKQGDQVRVDIVYDFKKGTEYFVSLQTSFVPTEDYKVMVSYEELISTTE